MITKEFVLIAMKSLRQEQSLRDHGGALEDIFKLNPKFLDLIPPALLLARPTTLPAGGAAEPDWRFASGRPGITLDNPEQTLNE